MTPARAGLRSATAAGLAALAVGIPGFPQPFLAVLTSVLVVVQVNGDGRFLWQNFCAIGSGAVLGGCGLILCAQQPWLLLPVVGVVAGVGSSLWWRGFGQIAAMIFLMAVVATLGTGIIHPEGAMAVSFSHGASLILAVTAAAFARAIFSENPTKGDGGHSPLNMPPVVPEYFGPLTGLSVMAGFGVAALILPEYVVPLLISVVTTCCGVFPWPDRSILVQKIQGAFLGGVVSLVFLILVIGAGNDLAILLVGILIILGGFEALARNSIGQRACFRQAAAVFAVAATMLPAPLEQLNGVLLRIGSVWVGFALVLVIGSRAAVIAINPTSAKARSRELPRP